MTPVYQTKHGPPDGNCFAACVASLLDTKIEDVDVDVASCGAIEELLAEVQIKANCRIYAVPYQALLEGILTTLEPYCIAKVCTFVFDNNPYDPRSTWHEVVCEITAGKISLAFNPDQRDQRQRSLDQFAAVSTLYFVKANPQPAKARIAHLTMKPTKLQMKLLRFYAKYETRPLTPFRIALSFWLLWLLLLLPAAAGFWLIRVGWPNYGCLLIGVSIGAFLREVNRILSLSRTWAVIHEIIKWERLSELMQIGT